MTLAKNNHGTVLAMATKWGIRVRRKANNARSQQLRYFKNVWLSNTSPHAIVTNVIAKDLDKKTRTYES
jgi:hypothetical protein